MRVLLTGATGFLGRKTAAELASRGHGVIGTARGGAAWGGLAEDLADELAADLTEPGAAEGLVGRGSLEAVIHLAALSDIAPCRRRPDLAARLNAEVPGELARACAARSLRFVAVSTDQVFDGSRGPWTETDEPRPLHLYGETKLAGERAVLAGHPQAAVVRPALITGLAPSGGRSASSGLIDALVRGESPRMFTDEVRSPVAIADVARALVDLVEAMDGRPDTTGLFHCGGPEALSRFELALREASAAGMGTERILAGTRAEAGLADERPADLSLDSSRLVRLLGWAPSALQPPGPHEPT